MSECFRNSGDVVDVPFLSYDEQCGLPPRWAPSLSMAAQISALLSNSSPVPVICASTSNMIWRTESRSMRCAVRTWSGLVLHTNWERLNLTVIVDIIYIASSMNRINHGCTCLDNKMRCVRTWNLTWPANIANREL